MTRPDDSAFPVDEPTFGHNVDIGLTKREYFAAIAMKGIISDFNNHIGYTPFEVAQKATIYADALILQLNK